MLTGQSRFRVVPDRNHCNPALPCRRIVVSILLLFLVASAMDCRVAMAADRAKSDPSGASHGHLSFYADLAAHREAALGTRLDVMVEVPYTSLRFARGSSGWVARFDVTVLVYDRGGNQVNGDIWTIPVRSADAGRDQAAGLVLRRRFPLVIAEGQLRVDIRVLQAGSGRQGEWSRSIDVPRWDGLQRRRRDV